jgi:hypothetical protein
VQRQLEILADSCVVAALPVLTYIKYAPVRFSLRLALDEAFQLGNLKRDG